MRAAAYFWICLTLALLNIAGLIFLSSQGLWSWPGVGLSAWWLLMAWFHGSRVPST